jgi:Uma2 family endonuclease
MTVATDNAPHRLTWEAFIERPEELLRNAELHDGEVVQMASPDRPHQLALMKLIGALLPWVDQHGGELVTDPHVRIADYWGYQPVLAYYAPDRVPGSGYWKLAPNLAVEILPPSTRRKDLLRKPTHYFRSTCRSCGWSMWTSGSFTCCGPMASTTSGSTATQWRRHCCPASGQPSPS